MMRAKKGDKVRINYTGTLEDGTVFDSTLETECCDDDDCGCESGPLELVIGGDEFFPQVEEGLIGMAPGESKTVVIPAEDAFGEYDENEVFAIGREQFVDDLEPHVGMELEFTGDDDEPVEVTVVEVRDDAVIVDANHPLAGEDVTYTFELLEIL